jgi:hypothetical protein
MLGSRKNRKNLDQTGAARVEFNVAHQIAQPLKLNQAGINPRRSFGLLPGQGRRNEHSQQLTLSVGRFFVF